jgi:hypothetical protein
MDPFTHDSARIVLIGTAATAVLDLWLLALKRLDVPTLDMALLGRWAGHLAGGTWRHDSIARAAPVQGERALGWLVHYATGIAFAGLLAGLAGTAWMHHPSLPAALGLGVATVVLPLFVMQPAMGAGIASSRTATPVRNCIRSLANHAVFGAGLYLAALLVERLSR